MRLPALRRFTPLLALAAAAACSDQALGRHPLTPTAINMDVIDPNVTPTELCVWGPAGTYSFHVAATDAGTTGYFYQGLTDFSLPMGSTQEFDNFICRSFWIPINGQAPSVLTMTDNSSTPDSVVVAPKDSVSQSWIRFFQAPNPFVWPDAGHASYVVDAQHGYMIKFYHSTCTDPAAMNNGGLKPCLYGRLGDFVWQDLDRNGLQNDGAASGMSGITVDLSTCTDNTFTNCTPAGSTQTNSSGNYLFEHLAAGCYQVTVATPDGFAPASSTQGSDRAIDSNGSPTNTCLSTTKPEDLTLDFGFVKAVCTDPMASNYNEPGDCIYPSCPSGSFTFAYQDATGLHIEYDQFPAPNDNSYGVNAVGWPNGHKFSDLTGSDHAGFQLIDPNGVIRLSFNVDYLHANTAAPSGYSSLGVTGGDGKMIVGTADGITATSSLARNLNNINIPGLFNAAHVQQFGSVNLLINSPPTDPAHQTYVISDPLLTGWDFHDTYFVDISAAKLASLGFNFDTWKVEPNLANLHNSPAKPCPPSGDVLSVTKYEVKDKQVKITVMNSGSTNVFLNALALTWPLTNGKLVQVKLDGDVVYDNPDISGGTANLTLAQLVADQNKRKLDHNSSDVYTLIFEKNADPNLSHYTGTVTFDAITLTVLP